MTPVMIRNYWHEQNEEEIDVQIRRGKWSWLGRTVRKYPEGVEERCWVGVNWTRWDQEALEENRGKRSKGRRKDPSVRVRFCCGGAGVITSYVR